MTNCCNLKNKGDMIYEDVPRCGDLPLTQIRPFKCGVRSSFNTGNMFHASHLLLVSIVSATISGLVTGVLCIYCCRIMASHELMNVLLDQKSTLLRIQVRQLQQEQQYTPQNASNSESMEQVEYLNHLKEDSDIINVTNWSSSVNNEQNFVETIARDSSSSNVKNRDLTLSWIDELFDLNNEQKDLNFTEERLNLTFNSRGRRNVPSRDKGGLNGDKAGTSGVKETAKKPLSSKQPKKPGTAFIHLQLDIGELDFQAQGKLKNENGTHKLEYGIIYRTNTNLGFQTNDLNGLIQNWKEPEWSAKHSRHTLKYSEEEGSVSVLKEGLYFVYAQIRYYQNNLSGFEIRINNSKRLLKCLDGTESANTWRYNTCYVGAVKLLNKGDTLRVLDLYAKTSTSALNPHYIHIGEDVAESNYWGAFRLSQ